MVSKEFRFLYNGKLVMAEIDYYPGLTKSLDGVEVKGDITDEDENEVDVPESVLIKEFNKRYYSEVEIDRMELVAEKMGMRSIRVEV
jgi:hypothetical protein